MRQQLPHVPVERAIERMDAVWAPKTAPHHLILAQTRAGKTTLIKRILRTRPRARVLILDPKTADDEAWADEPGQENTWGRPVTTINPGFGSEREGGGPHGCWFRLVATGNQAADIKAFASAFQTVRDDGHTILVVDDAREICRVMRLGDAVETVTMLGGSNAISVILATQELSYIPGRKQAAFTWIGYTGGWDAAKEAAHILGQRGSSWYEAMNAIPQRTFCYHDNQPGNPGPVLVS